ncbi:Utp14 protein-domain-containing protein [Schizophyllum amplum]|uniref:Utp14 protein-domain-containing protein n=1 Tax=Schizophyllum amplum TaxID=97359 RepID=A0A550CRM5_9AGAR|nr:Utp14 protein-domain-containing protein [Auriculariopsis ampla]
MARTAHRFTKPKSSRSAGPQKQANKNSNALGYAKRQAQRSKSHAATDRDVYEYAPDTKGERRAKIKMDFDPEEIIDVGGAEEREELRARLIGEDSDDEGGVDSADDEEIASDDAFDEDDDDRFAGFFTKKKKTNKPRKRVEVDLNEDSDEDGDSQPEQEHDDDDQEEEEGEPGEFFDLLDILDGVGKIESGSDDEDEPSQEKDIAMEKPPAKHDDDDDEEEEEESEVGEDEASDDDFAASDMDEDYPEGLEDLQNFVSTLDTSTGVKRKPTLDDDSALPSRPAKRRILPERTEAGPENEFRAATSGSKIGLEDLLAPLANESSSALESLKQAAKVLRPSTSSSKRKAQTLAAPLAQRAQERLDREAAYEQTKEEVDKWTDTMKRIREAEHLSFPLQRPTRDGEAGLVAKFKPTTALETSIDRLLKAAALRESDLEKTEDAMLEGQSELTLEEVAARRAELRKMRDLMTRAELKARRANKIKSRTYRKLQRRAKDKLAIAGEDDDMDSDDPEGQARRDVERARERATLRHKHTGKWARMQKGKHDENTRSAMEEMLDRGERLRRRIEGRDSDDESGEGEDSDEEGEAAADPEEVRRRAFEELAGLDDKGKEAEEGQSKGARAVFEMKFMKEAMARKDAAATRVVDDYVRELGGAEGSDAEGEGDGAEGQDDPSGVISLRQGGRLTFRPGVAASDASSVTLKSTDFVSPAEDRFSTDGGEENPWLAPRDAPAKVTRKKNEVVVSKDSKPLDKSRAKMEKKGEKRQAERERAADDAVVDIDVSSVLSKPAKMDKAAEEKSGEKGKKAGKHDTAKKTVAASPTSASAPTDAVNSEDDSEDEVELQEQALLKKKGGKNKGPAAFAQRDLVAMAFAGDNVVRQFEEAKQAEVNADAPKEIDTTLPGWGSWGGTGLKQRSKPKFVKQVPGVAPAARADAGKKHLIVSERKDKKAAKYVVRDLPYPYTSVAQYERSMERPLGAEWNTRVGFQRGTLPKVVKKMGTVIDPLEKLHS